MNKILLRTEISRLAPHVRGGVAVHFPVRRVVPGGGACVEGRTELRPSRRGHLTGPEACGRHAPGAARVLRAPGRRGANVGAEWVRVGEW